MRDTIKQLRAALPALMTVDDYCDLTGRCVASAYNDLRNKPGLAVKVGGSTRFLRDRVLAEMTRHEWIPQKDRAGAVTTPKELTRPRKRTAAPRRERDPEMRA
jgi:hypothetical protein